MDSAPVVRRVATLIVAGLALLTLTGAATVPWTVDRDASRIELSVRAFGGSHSGRFGDWRGDIVFDPADPDRTRATVIVQSASLAMSPAVASARATSPRVHLRSTTACRRRVAPLRPSRGYE